MVPMISFLGKSFSAYTLIATAGVLLFLFYTYRVSKREGLDEISMLFASLFGALGALIGSHLLYGATQPEFVRSLFANLFSYASFRDFFDAAFAAFGGSVFYGGLIGGLAAGFLYLSRKKVDVMAYADVAAPAIPMFHTLGRIGCFLSGCCYGVESHVGFVYHYALAPGANDVRRFPIQLVEAFGNLVIFLVLDALLRKKKCRGCLIYLYGISYAALRFATEFFRGDVYRGIFGPFSTSQWISLLLFAFSLAGLLRARLKRKEKSEIA